MTLRHTKRFHFQPSTRRSSSSCHWRACPRLSTSGSWAKCSTPSSRSQSYPIHLVSIFLSSTRNALSCPGGGSGASWKAHRHAARAGRARDHSAPRLPRHGALILSHGQPLAPAHPRPVAPGAAATESHRGSSRSARLCRQCRVSRRLSGWPLRGLPRRAPLVRTICSSLLLLPGLTLSDIVDSQTHVTSRG